MEAAPLMATELPIRIGVMGCAEIARKVSRAIHLAPNATLAAIASRSLEKAKAFAAANAYPPMAKIHGSYESLLEDTEVDALYLPLPTSLHSEWAVRAAERGKHILLEKPVAMNVSEFDKILEACEANGVQFMDGTMWFHNPRTAKMKEFLSDQEQFGQLKTVHSCFSFAATEDDLKNNIRVKPNLDGLGALGDVGWYTIQAILLANSFQLPKTVTALSGAVLNDVGVILSCGASFDWGNGRTGTIYCSFLANRTMEITTIGTKGTLCVNDFNIPFLETEASFTTLSGACMNDLGTAWVKTPSEHKVKSELPQEVCMVREFARLVGEIKYRGGRSDGVWGSLSRKTQVVADAVKESVDKNCEVINLFGR